MIKDKYTKNQFLKRCPDNVPNFIGEKSDRTRQEDSELVDVTNWFKYQWPQHAMSYIHVPNEGKADHGGHRRNNKQKGLLSGAHDILILIPSGEYGFLTVELKRSDHKSTVTEEQIQFAVSSINNGGYSCFAWGLDQAKLAISEYMETRRD